MLKSSFVRYQTKLAHKLRWVSLLQLSREAAIEQLDGAEAQPTGRAQPRLGLDAVGTAIRLMEDGCSDDEVERLTGLNLQNILLLRVQQASADGRGRDRSDGAAAPRRPGHAIASVDGVDAQPQPRWAQNCVVVPTREPLKRAQDGAAVCFVKSGWAARVRLLEGGGRQIVELLLPGDHERLSSRSAPMTDGLVAIGRCEVAKVPLSVVEATLATSPSLEGFFKAAEERRCRMLEESLVRIGRRSAFASLAHLICELLVRLGGAGPLTSCACPATQEDFADMLGLSVVHVNRTLQALRKDKLVDLSKNRLSTPDFAALAAAADFSPAYLARSL
ncbi:MAG: Crp/Fnr family transcriptional regulator [Caulobacteraceae bacterium]|nr:Crp/Fnr family transcriptional regulator [Caulobacter sp.]